VIIADTHAWLWALVAPSRLSARARTALEGDAVGVSAMSCWDMLIAATALEYGAPLVSRDRGMAAVPGLEVIW